MRQGFTLTELLVAIAIFLVIVGISFASFRAGNDSTTLRHAAEKTSGLIQDALARSQVGQHTYGVHAEPGQSSVVLFIDSDNDLRFDADEGVETLQLDARGEVTVRNDPGDIVIDAVFIPPTPTILINGDPSIAQTSIVLIHPRVGAAQSININVVSGRVTD